MPLVRFVTMAYNIPILCARVVGDNPDRRPGATGIAVEYSPFPIAIAEHLC